MSNVVDINAHRPAPLPTPMPSSIDAEQALIGAVLVNNDAYRVVAAFVSAEDFADPVHAKVWSLIGSTIEGGGVANPVTLRTYLGDVDLGGMTPAAYLARLATEVVSIIQAPTYARFIRDLAVRRALIASAGELTMKLAAPDPAVTAGTVAADFLEQTHAMISTAAAVDTRRDLGAAAGALLDRVRGIREGIVADHIVSTGLLDLDRETGAYAPGTLWVVGARPGMGKTAFMTASSRRVAEKGVGALNLSLEVPEDQIVARHLADLAYRYRNPLTIKQIQAAVDLTDEDLWCLEDAHKRLTRLPIVLDVASRMTVSQIAARVRTERKRMERRGLRLGVVFIDYLKFIKATDRYKGMRVYEVGEITAGLKEIAKEEHVCIVLLAQLNRGTEDQGRRDKRPNLADLRESGDLEADAHVVGFLYREEYYLRLHPGVRENNLDILAQLDASRNKLELILAKNRTGPTGLVNLWCDVAASTVDNVDRWGQR